MKKYIVSNSNSTHTWNVEWKNAEGNYEYENFLSNIMISEFVQDLLDSGCYDISIRYI